MNGLQVTRSIAEEHRCVEASKLKSIRKDTNCSIGVSSIQRFYDCENFPIRRVWI